MQNYQKPAIVPAWAETAASPVDKLQPADADIAGGWPQSAVPPSRQRFNWILSWLANAIRYFMQRGLSDWDPAELYSRGARVIAADNKSYECIADTSIGNPPPTSPGFWKRWGFNVDELASYAFSSPTAVTPADGDNSTKIATTGFVQRAMQALGNYLTVAAFNAAIAAYATVAWVQANFATIAQLATKQNLLGFTPVQQGTGVGQLANTVKLGWDGGRLRATVDNADLSYLWTNASSVFYGAETGYLMLPNGIILQWGNIYSPANTVNLGTLPIAFPTAFLSIIGSVQQQSGTGGGASFWPVNAAQFNFYTSNNVTVRWFAIGY
jgi:hypothetical protein